MNTRVSSLSKEELDAIHKEMSHYNSVRAVSIEALKIVQKNRGWVSDEMLKDIAQVLNLSVCDLEEIATFYSQIFRKPVGRYIIYFCDSVVCYITGYEKIKVVLEEILTINIGETSADGKFTLLPTCCLGKCDQGPVIMINHDIYTHLTPESIAHILEKYK